MYLTFNKIYLYDQSEHMEKNKTSSDEWSIGELYKTSWNLIKNNKVLWLFGMASALLGSAHFNSGSNFNVSKYFPGPTSSPMPGASSAPSGFGLAGQLFASVPVEKYVLLGILVAVLVILGIVLNLIYGAWATSSLIHGVMAGLGNQKVTIKDSSSKAFSAIKGLIWLQIVPALFLLVCGGIFFFLLIGLVGALPGAAKAVPVILMAVLVVILVAAFVYLALSEIWAQRRVILEGQKAKEALMASFAVAKKVTGSMIVLAILNTLLSFLILLIPLSIVGGAGLLAFFFFLQNHSIGGNLIIGGIIFLLLAGLAYTLLAGVLQSFKASVWTIAYEKVKGKFNAA